VKDIVRNVTGGEQMNFKLIAIIILVSIAAIFLVQNVAAVEVTFLFWSISMSRALLIFFTLIIGLFSAGPYTATCLIEKQRMRALILKNLNNRSKEILNDRIKHASS
jgi:uncharacterized integral membrane protein